LTIVCVCKEGWIDRVVARKVNLVGGNVVLRVLIELIELLVLEVANVNKFACLRCN
jgi:hypothetical protein